MTELNIETVAKAVQVEWKVAHQSENITDWLRRWGGVEDMLDGMWSLLNYSDLTGVQGLMAEILWLRSIANELRYSWTKFREAGL